AFDLDFCQANNILTNNFPFKLMLKWFQSVIDGLDDCFKGFAVFDTLINLVFNKDFLKRSIVPFLFQFPFLYLKFPCKQVNSMVCVCFEYFGYSEECRFVVLDYTGIRRDCKFTVCKCIKGIYGLVRRSSGSKVNEDLNVFGSIVVYLPDFDLALVN